MEKFLIEHSFIELSVYAVILGCCLAVLIGCIISLIRLGRYLHEERKIAQLPWWDVDESVEAWHELGQDYLDVMEELYQ